MALYAIGDLHLSLNSDKPMDIFGEKWHGYVDKIRAGFAPLHEDDVTVLCGDLSWGMSLEESLEDFRFIHALPGKKILMKGNHDYWWSTAAKFRKFCEENGFENLNLLNNNCYEYEGVAICGTRGWFYEEDRSGEHDEKVFKRELLRLEASLKAAGDMRKMVFLHYPPLYQGYQCPEILRLLREYEVKVCCYGHLHGPVIRRRQEGKYGNTEFSLISGDYLGFVPKKICEK